MPLVVAKKVKRFVKCNVVSEGRNKCKHQCSFCKMCQYEQDGLPGKPYFYGYYDERGNIRPLPDDDIQG